jgi:hypothetical protein
MLMLASTPRRNSVWSKAARRSRLGVAGPRKLVG